MKNYDNYFLPVDNMEEAKRYYEEILGLKKKFDFSDKGMVAYNIGNEEPAIILKDKLVMQSSLKIHLEIDLALQIILSKE